MRPEAKPCALIFRRARLSAARRFLKAPREIHLRRLTEWWNSLTREEKIRNKAERGHAPPEPGHFGELLGRQVAVQKALNSLDKCSKHWQDTHAPELEALRNVAERVIPQPHWFGSFSLTKFLGSVGIGYLIYRGIRLLPSLAPPLWGTLPLNLATP